MSKLDLKGETRSGKRSIGRILFVSAFVVVVVISVLYNFASLSFMRNYKGFLSFVKNDWQCDAGIGGPGVCDNSSSAVIYNNRNVFWSSGAIYRNATLGKNICGHGKTSTYRNISSERDVMQKDFPLLSRTRLGTYGDSGYEKCLARHVVQGTRFGFNQVGLYCRERFSEAFKQDLKPVLKQRRGGGYWIWKFNVIMQNLKEMKDGDFLVYSDCGNTWFVNEGAKKKMEELLKRVKEHKNGPNLAGYLIPHLEKVWTSKAVFDAFTESPIFNPQNKTQKELINSAIADTRQIEASRLVLQKTNTTMQFFDNLTKLILTNPLRITDEYNKQGGLPDSGFKENRHDQSFFSVGIKLSGGVMFEAENGKDPVKATRNKWNF
eukprot:Nk52_evm6s260 gene=Nk52_evmTU6s260